MFIRIVSLTLAFGGLGLAIFADKKAKKVKEVKQEKVKAPMPQLKPVKPETPPEKPETPPEEKEE